MSAATPDERIVELRGRGLGDGTQRILQLAEQLGYSAAAASQGSYRLARSRRRLIGKHTESVLVSVYDDRGGTKARFVGPVDPALLQHLMADAPPTGMARGADPAVPLRPSIDPSAPLSQPRGDAATPPLGCGPTLPPTLPRPAQRPSPRVAPAQPGGLISSVPGLTGGSRAPLVTPPSLAPAPHVESLELDGRTIANVQRDDSPPAAPSEPGLVLPDGRFVPLTEPAVIGRDPDATPGGPGARSVPVAEPSLSKTHLMVAVAPGGVEVTDLHSSNGTIVEVSGSRAQCVPGIAMLVPRSATVIAGALLIEVVGL